MDDELLQLIEINKNIEKQNSEIIRLLKIIAGESDTPEEDVEEEIPQESYFVDTSLDAGEVLFVDNLNIYKLSVKNNETSIHNFTSDDEPHTFKLQELIANETIKRNQKLEDATVILDDENIDSLPETFRVCIDHDVKNIYVPIKKTTELLGAPPVLMTLINFDFFKNEEDLIEKLFKGE